MSVHHVGTREQTVTTCERYVRRNVLVTSEWGFVDCKWCQRVRVRELAAERAPSSGDARKETDRG